MSGFPEEGRFSPGAVDPVSGARWIHVTPAMARAHPKGRPGPGLWLVVGYFGAMAAVRTVQFGALGGAVPAWLWGALVGVPMLCAVGLALRVPWAALAVIGLSAVSMLGNLAFVKDGDMMVVGNIIALVLIVFYLLEGDRPNLIYRHRYRSYRG